MAEPGTRHRVGRAADLPPGRHVVVRAGNRELGIFNIGGTLHALPNLCPHQRGPCARARPPVRSSTVRRRAGSWLGDTTVRS